MTTDFFLNLIIFLILYTCTKNVGSCGQDIFLAFFSEINYFLVNKSLYCLNINILEMIHGKWKTKHEK